MSVSLREGLAEILKDFIWFDPIEHVDTNDEENDKRTADLITTATDRILALIGKCGAIQLPAAEIKKILIQVEKQWSESSVTYDLEEAQAQALSTPTFSGEK